MKLGAEKCLSRFRNGPGQKTARTYRTGFGKVRALVAAGFKNAARVGKARANRAGATVPLLDALE